LRAVSASRVGSWRASGARSTSSPQGAFSAMRRVGTASSRQRPANARSNERARRLPGYSGAAIRPCFLRCSRVCTRGLLLSRLPAVREPHIVPLQIPPFGFSRLASAAPTSAGEVGEVGKVGELAHSQRVAEGMSVSLNSMIASAHLGVSLRTTRRLAAWHYGRHLAVLALRSLALLLGLQSLALLIQRHHRVLLIAAAASMLLACVYHMGLPGEAGGCLVWLL
jgi:hypothetical protein